jgi:hypothetical protein
MKDLYLLLDAIHEAYSRPEYIPSIGTTHCNQFVAEVALKCGFKGLDGLLANDIVDYLANSDQWSETPMDKAQELANKGTLIIAGVHGDPHGHVNVVCPGREKTSGRWGAVPSVANIGKDIFIGRGLNWAFSDPPKLYCWRLSL